MPLKSVSPASAALIASTTKRKTEKVASASACRRVRMRLTGSTKKFDGRLCDSIHPGEPSLARIHHARLTCEPPGFEYAATFRVNEVFDFQTRRVVLSHNKTSRVAELAPLGAFTRVDTFYQVFGFVAAICIGITGLTAFFTGLDCLTSRTRGRHRSLSGDKVD